MSIISILSSKAKEQNLNSLIVYSSCETNCLSIISGRNCFPRQTYCIKILYFIRTQNVVSVEYKSFYKFFIRKWCRRGDFTVTIWLCQLRSPWIRQNENGIARFVSNLAEQQTHCSPHRHATDLQIFTRHTTPTLGCVQAQLITISCDNTVINTRSLQKRLSYQIWNVQDVFFLFQSTMAHHNESTTHS